jgi:hypothetical protein
MTAVMPGMKAGKVRNIMLIDMAIVTIITSIILQGMVTVIIASLIMIAIIVSITLRGTIVMADITTLLIDITRLPL